MSPVSRKSVCPVNFVTSRRNPLARGEGFRLDIDGVVVLKAQLPIRLAQRGERVRSKAQAPAWEPGHLPGDRQRRLTGLRAQSKGCRHRQMRDGGKGSTGTGKGCSRGTGRADVGATAALQHQRRVAQRRALVQVALACSPSLARAVTQPQQRAPHRPLDVPVGLARYTDLGTGARPKPLARAGGFRAASRASSRDDSICVPNNKYPRRGRPPGPQSRGSASRSL